MPRLTVALWAAAGPVFHAGPGLATLEAAAAAGYDAVDVVVRDAAAAAELPALRAATGLSVGALHTGPACTFDGLTLSDRRTAAAALDRVAEIAAVAAELGAAMIVGLLLGHLPEGGDDRARAETTLVESLREAADRARAAGSTLLVETLNRYESNAAPTAAAATAHASQVDLVHLSDSNRRMPGDGHFPTAAWIAALREGGYEGPFAIEAQFGPDAMGDARRALAACRGLGV